MDTPDHVDDFDFVTNLIQKSKVRQLVNMSRLE